MWTITDNGILVNFEAVRSVGLEVSDDRQFVEVQVRWLSGGERFAVATLIVQDYGDVSTAMTAAQLIVDAIREKLRQEGKIFELPPVLKSH